MIDSQRAQRPLELAGGVQAIGRGRVAKEAQSIGVKGRGRAVFFKAGTDDAEMAPGGVFIETAGHNAPGMIVGGEDERLLLRTGPPLVRRGIMLVKFSNGRALPAPARLGAARILRDEIRVMLLNVIGDAWNGRV